MVLEEYRDVLGQLAGTVGMLHLILPACITLQVIRQGSTENISPLHFTMGGSLTLLFVRHGQLLNAPPMVTSALIGFGLSLVYLIIFAYYHDKKRELALMFLKFLSLPALLISYSLLDERSRAENVFGGLISMLMFCLMSIPLFQIKQIIKQKHTGDLSLMMALFGIVQSTLWFLYSLTLGNYLEIFTRFLGCALIIPQLVIFCIYPMPKSTAKKDKEDKRE